MKALAALVLVALALPAPALARRRHHHARAHRASACEYPGQPSRAEWREGMAAEGFTAAETAALEVCDEG